MTSPLRRNSNGIHGAECGLGFRRIDDLFHLNPRKAEAAAESHGIGVSGRGFQFGFATSLADIFIFGNVSVPFQSA